MKKLLFSFILGLIVFNNVYAQYETNVPVYIHAKDTDILAKNSNLYTYWHLTNHYFYRKPGPDGQTYDYRDVDPEIYKKNYLDNVGRRTAKDINHPWMKRSMILDLEMRKLNLVDDPNWWQWTQEYINITRMTRAAGKPAAVYGISAGASEFQIWWNMGRYRWFLSPRLNPKYYKSTEAQKNYWKLKLKQFEAKEQTLISRIETISNRFRDEIDAVVVEIYAPYEIANADQPNWKFYAWTYYIEQKIAMASIAYPDKPIYVFLQPNFTTTWKPIPLDVWNATFQFVSSNEDVDRIYIFTLKDKKRIEGWDAVFTGGPDSDE